MNWAILIVFVTFMLFLISGGILLSFGPSEFGVGLFFGSLTLLYIAQIKGIEKRLAEKSAKEIYNKGQNNGQ